jgi:Lon protease-like protein
MSILRLFPLNTVVFPRQQMPLHVFEQRYRQLVREVLEEDGEFGISLIRSGPEVGGDAKPNTVGCTVRITNAEELPDGRFNIACEGVRRFRLVELLTPDPYPRGEVEFFVETGGDWSDATLEFARTVSEQYTHHLELSLALQNSWQRSFRFPSDPRLLADYAAGRVDAVPIAKQEMLEAEQVARRLELVLRALRVENARLGEQLSAHQRRTRSGLGTLN